MCYSACRKHRRQDFVPTQTADMTNGIGDCGDALPAKQQTPPEHHTIFVVRHSVTKQTSKFRKRYALPGLINSQHTMHLKLAKFISNLPTRKMSSAQPSAAADGGSNSNGDRDKSKKESGVPKCIGKIASITCRLFRTVRSKECLRRANKKAGIKDVEAAIRQAQKTCETLADAIRTTQSQDEAAKTSRHRLEERLDQYRHHREWLAHKAEDADQEEAVALALSKEVQEVSKKIETIEILLKREIAGELDRQATLQLRYKTLHAMRELENHLTALVGATPLPLHEQKPQTHIPRNEIVVVNGQGPDDSFAQQQTDKASTEHRIARRPVPEQTTLPEPRQAAMEKSTANVLCDGFGVHQDTDCAKLTTSSPQEVVPGDLYQEYTRAKSRYTLANYEFELRDYHRHDEHVRNRRMLQRTGGKYGLPQEDFDLQWVVYIAKLTRELIDSEVALKNARIAAENGGWNGRDSDISSGFAKEESEAYPPDLEDKMKATAPKEMIENWRRSVFAINPEIKTNTPELDPWAGDEPGLGCSWSTVADPQRQAAIEEWRNLLKDLARLDMPLPEQSSPNKDPLYDAPEATDLRQEYWDARIRLFVAQRDFDNRDEKRESEGKENNRRLQGSGSMEAMPRTELGLRWLKHISKLTRKLIDTEEAFKKAKVAALDGGYVPSDSSVSSVFDDGSDGYSPSFENEIKATAPKEMIEDWRQAIPEDPEIGAEPEDHIHWPEIGAAESEDHIPWEGREPEVWWESSSAVAEPRHHIKIQAWWKSCVAADKGPE
jgi:hypothetical protein